MRNLRLRGGPPPHRGSPPMRLQQSLGVEQESDQLFSPDRSRSTVSIHLIRTSELSEFDISKIQKSELSERTN